MSELVTRIQARIQEMDRHNEDDRVGELLWVLSQIMEILEDNK